MLLLVFQLGLDPGRLAWVCTAHSSVSIHGASVRQNAYYAC